MLDHVCVRGGGYLKSYIIRIYRAEDNNPGNIIGIAEEVEAGEKRAFTNIEELWNILNYKYGVRRGGDKDSIGKALI